MLEEKKEHYPVKAIADECMDAPGYVIFAAILSEDGKKINFRYSRRHYSYEDMGKAIKSFRQHFQEDMEDFQKENI